MSKKAVSAQTVAEDEINLELPESDSAEEVGGPTQYDLLTYPADFTLEVLHTKWKAQEIEIPKTQRGYVWKQPQASRLIESFLIGLPVPPIFLYAEKEREKLLVVDGQQRLRTVVYFFDGHFEEEKSQKQTVFRLKLGDKNKWDAQSFGDLSDDEKRRLRNCVLRAYIMRQVSPVGDDTSIYNVFERLNTGGTSLNSQEVRNCLYDGPFNDLLKDLNTQSDWRKILGRPDPDRRFKDVELILRFLALFEQGKEYETPMKVFLSKFMARNKNGGTNERFKKAFVRVSKEVLASLGERPFHVKTGVNQAVFDAVFVAFGLRKRTIPKDIAKRYKSLVGDEDFLELTRRATTDAERVRKRADIASQQLFG